MKMCKNCGTLNDDNVKFCGACGARFETSDAASSSSTASHKTSAESIAGQMMSADYWMNQVNQYVGNEQPSKLNWTVLFTDVFKNHTTDDAERIFISGTKTTTPPLEAVSREWPRPWLYARVLLMFFIASCLLWLCVTAFGNENAVPGFIVVSSFAVPFSTVVLFLELNVWRNFSLYQIFKVFFIGGCASLVVTLLLFAIFPVGDLDYVGAFSVGIIEEVGKALIVFHFVRRLNQPKILPAMLIGSCVGAGFAAFESAGYAFRFLLGGGWDALMDVIFLRGILAPGGHVAWAAISGAAMVIAFKAASGDMEWGLLTKKSFLRLFIIPVVLHGLWDSPLMDIPNAIIPYSGHAGLILLVWVFILVLCNMGLNEVNKEASMLSKPAASTAVEPK